MNNTLKVMLDPGAYAPVRAHEDDAGLDLISPVDVNIWTHGREAICTGVHVQIPKGYVGMITAKSGLMRDHGIITTGTIDAGYTGPINVVLFNTGDHIFSVKRGMKIAQLVIKQIITPQIEVVDELEETERGAGGFGSTGAYASEEEFETAVQRNLARLYEEQERRKTAEGPTMAKCRGCGREIIFVRSVKGKMIPCDPGMITFYPDEKNGEQVYVDTEGRVVKGYPKEDGSFCGGFGDWAARHGYISHFATCPQADRFRRR